MDEKDGDGTRTQVLVEQEEEDDLSSLKEEKDYGT